MLPSQAQSAANAFLRLSQRIDTQCAFFHKNFHQNFRKATNETHYDVLGVPSDASDKEIKKAFIELSKKVHPDADSKDKTLHDKFVKINRAYSVLSKPSERKIYDEGLKAGFHVEPDEVSTAETWNPNQTQYYYHPRFYKDPEMRKQAAKTWKAHTGYSFAEYEKEVPHEGRLTKTASVYLCIFLMLLGSLLGYLQYLNAKSFVTAKRNKSAEIEERTKMKDTANVVSVGRRVRDKKSLETREEEKDLTVDSLAGPASILSPEPLKT
ncbi:dnaJ homolog subfamily C member 4-like [Mercenaria mercenaria]|uniref:dnaJ homolog subfamily C member 4-like n=1 Tax=Mercenaria mercenaria TaxID=6596 RepID=UPI00234F0F4F|nr:dnaJ homolog subfamily C member 4-like [Mercenaria mercenaria]